MQDLVDNLETRFLEFHLNERCAILIKYLDQLVMAEAKDTESIIKLSPTKCWFCRWCFPEFVYFLVVERDWTIMLG